MIRCLPDRCILAEHSRLTMWGLSGKLSLVCLLWTTRGLSRTAGTLAGEKPPLFWEVLSHSRPGLFPVLWYLNRPSHWCQISRGKILIHLSHRSHRKKWSFPAFSPTGSCHVLQGPTETPKRSSWGRSQELGVYGTVPDSWESMDSLLVQLLLNTRYCLTVIEPLPWILGEVFSLYTHGYVLWTCSAYRHHGTIIISSY